MFFRALDEKKHMLNASDVADNFKTVNCNVKLFLKGLKIGNTFK